MEFAPEGYISVRQAVDEIWERLYPGFPHAPIPFFREEVRNGEPVQVPTPDAATAHQEEGRRQAREAREVLLEVLADGSLSAIVATPDHERWQVPRHYWDTGEARTTLSTSHLELPQLGFEAWRALRLAPCYLETKSFTAWRHSLPPRADTVDQIRRADRPSGEERQQPSETSGTGRQEDPFLDPYWTLPMLIGWVWLCDPDLVRQAAPFEARSELALTALVSYVMLERGEEVDKLPIYSDVEREILHRLQDGSISCIGVRNNRGNAEPIPRHQWTDLKFYDKPMHAGPSDPYRPEADSWSRLRFDRAELFRVWPAQAVAAAPVDPMRTGTAGRPTIKHFLIAEMENRARRGELDAKISREARALVAWAIDNLPGMPCPGARSLENAIRHRFRQLWKNRPPRDEDA